jgi:hypothetical protein
VSQPHTYPIDDELIVHTALTGRPRMPIRAVWVHS